MLILYIIDMWISIKFINECKRRITIKSENVKLYIYINYRIYESQLKFKESKESAKLLKLKQENKARKIMFNILPILM